jgi:hypothetical protein
VDLGRKRDLNKALTASSGFAPLSKDNHQDKAPSALLGAERIYYPAILPRGGGKKMGLGSFGVRPSGSWNLVDNEMD